MTKLYVAEYTNLAATDQSDSVPLVYAPPDVAQVVDYTAGAASSAAFAATTQFVEIEADSICSVKFGTAPVAAVTDMRMAANERRIIRVQAGAGIKVSAITNT